MLEKTLKEEWECQEGGMWLGAEVRMGPISVSQLHRAELSENSL